MTWSLNVDARSKTEAAEKIDASDGVPASMKAYLKDAVAQYQHEDSALKVVASGHHAQHENDVSNCSVSVHKV